MNGQLSDFIKQNIFHLFSVENTWVLLLTARSQAVLSFLYFHSDPVMSYDWEDSMCSPCICLQDQSLMRDRWEWSFCLTEIASIPYVSHMPFWVGHLKLLGRNAKQRKIRTDKMTLAKGLYWGLRSHIQIVNCYEIKRKHRQKNPNNSNKPSPNHTQHKSQPLHPP